jgi:hypothetical protein
VEYDREGLQRPSTRRNPLWCLHSHKVSCLLALEVGYRTIWTNTSHSFAFATIDPTTFEVKATSTGAQDLMDRIGTLKFLQPDLKIWIAIGGWAFSDNDQSTAKTFSILSASKPRQQAFAKSLISMMSTYGFDGVDIDWVSRLLPSLAQKADDIKVSCASPWLRLYTCNKAHGVPSLPFSIPN